MTMIYTVCSVFDVATVAFARPFFVVSVGQALRSFSDEVNRDHPENVMFQHPIDFQLFRLGAFDDALGVFQLLSAPERLALAVDVKLVPIVEKGARYVS